MSKYSSQTAVDMCKVRPDWLVFNALGVRISRKDEPGRVGVLVRDVCLDAKFRSEDRPTEKRKKSHKRGASAPR